VIAYRAYDGTLAVRGTHNARNAGAALAVARFLGADTAAAERGVAAFAGVGRRLELMGTAGQIRVVDDYAHHPAEIEATLAAARSTLADGRLLVLFQPHLYSRTRHLARELGAALAAADDVTVTDVYPAREQPIVGVSGKLVVDALSDLGKLPAWMPTVEQGVDHVARLARDGDVVLVIGAGDVDRAPALLRDRLER